MQDTRKDFTKSDLSIFISYMLPHKKLFALDMFLSALIAFIDLSFPYITRKAMNSLLPSFPRRCTRLFSRSWLLCWPLICCGPFSSIR